LIHRGHQRSARPDDQPDAGVGLAVSSGLLPQTRLGGLELLCRPGQLLDSEVQALAAAAGDHRLVVEMLAFTGLRFSELAALRGGRVDLLRRRLEIAESVTEANGATVLGTPKTHHRRSVPIPRSLVDELSQVVAGRAADDLVFASPEGGVLRVEGHGRRGVAEESLDRLDVGS
jgi:integrase